MSMRSRKSIISRCSFCEENSRVDDFETLSLFGSKITSYFDWVWGGGDESDNDEVDMGKNIKTSFF